MKEPYFGIFLVLLNGYTLLAIVRGVKNIETRPGLNLIIAGLLIASFSMLVQIAQYSVFFLTGYLPVDAASPFWLAKDIGYAVAATGVIRMSTCKSQD